MPVLKPGETAQLRLGLLCRQRGAFLLRGFRVETAFPLGLMVAQQVFSEEQPLLVYPRFTPLARLDAPLGRRYQPGGVALASNLGDSFEFIGNREYREGDPIRSIDWRATARLTRPVVREFREEYFLRTAVILDTFVPGLPGAPAAAAFERAVSVCAAVSDYMARSEYLVDLFAAGPELHQLTAGRSLAYLDEILDLLACVDSSDREDFRGAGRGDAGASVADRPDRLRLRGLGHRRGRSSWTVCGTRAPASRSSSCGTAPAPCRRWPIEARRTSRSLTSAEVDAGVEAV